MAKSGTLVTYRNHYRGQKAMIAAALSGAEIDVSYVDAPDASSPRVPSLRLPDGALLFDANAIAFRLADESLRGRDLDEATDVFQWTMFADQELLPAVCGWVFPLIGIAKADPKAVAESKELCLKLLTLLDEHLLFRTFFLGHRITLADVALFCNLTLVYEHALDPHIRKPFVCLNRWFDTVGRQPAFAAAVGDLAFCHAEPRLPDASSTGKPGTKVKKEKPGLEDSVPKSSVKKPTDRAFSSKEDLFRRFQGLSMEFVTINHPEVFTVDAMMPHLSALPVPGVVGKNLFLKDKKKKLYLLTVAHDRVVKLDAVAKAVSAPGGLRLADEAVLEKTLGVKQGCVTPYALVNDFDGVVTLLLDAAFVPGEGNDNGFAYFHPLSNAATTGISKDDLMRFLEEIQHNPKILDMTDS